MHFLNKYQPVSNDQSIRLDSLRGLSALLVAAAHAFQVFVAPVDHTLYGACGLLAQAAVMVFFVLSGFLITKSITRRYAAGFSASRYAADRANRIVPPLIVSLAICLALWWLAPFVFSTGTREFMQASTFMARPRFEVDALSLAGSLLFLNGFITKNISANAPLWSLPFEVWYYVAAGLIAHYRGSLGAIAAIVLIACLGAMNKFFALYSLVWFAGSFVCIAHNNGYTLRRAIPAAGIAFSIFAIFIGGYYLYTFASFDSPAQINMKVVAIYNLSIGLSFSCFLLLLLQGRARSTVVLSGTSAFSYTLYVIHFPVLIFLYGALQPYVLKLTPAMLAAIAGFTLCLIVSKYTAKHVESIRMFWPTRRTASQD